MKFQLEINETMLDRKFTSEEELKAYLVEWNKGGLFEVEDAEITVDAFFDLLKNEIGAVSCYSPAMCEMGDDYVEIELHVYSE